MPFVSIPGIAGKIYKPEKSCRAPCKHACADCYSCQLCSDERCRVCRGFRREHKKYRKEPSLRSSTDDRRQQREPK